MALNAIFCTDGRKQKQKVEGSSAPKPLKMKQKQKVEGSIAPKPKIQKDEAKAKG